jgi:hypothetical protein
MPQVSKTQFISIVAIASLSTAAVAFAFSSVSSDPSSSATADPVGDYFLHLRANDYTTYTDPVYGFSFPYPADFAVSNFFADDGETYVALLENSRLNLGIQIVVTPTDQDTAITAADISPSVIVDNPVEFFLPDGIPALRFYSKDDEGKDTGEIWFIYEGNLYQISMHAGSWFDAWPQELEQELTFQRI